MTCGNQIATRYRYNFDAISYTKPETPQRKAARRKLARLRAIKKVLHFIGFICFWATVLAVTCLAMLVAMFLFVALS